VTNKRKARGKASASQSSEVEAKSPANEDAEWRMRYSARILRDDLPLIGHAAYGVAKKAINKKLKKNPEGYGDPLGPPLEGLWKLRITHVRIAYHIEKADHEVWVLAIADRDKIWDRMEGEILNRFQGELMKQQERIRQQK
jgi:mRNA-degrading endonuclease RelE of RelBE toxin-antitoxin system